VSIILLYWLIILYTPYAYTVLGILPAHANP